jgi:hypothetical protein
MGLNGVLIIMLPIQVMSRLSRLVQIVVQKVMLIADQGMGQKILQRRILQFVEEVLQVLITVAACGARLSDLF